MVLRPRHLRIPLGVLAISGCLGGEIEPATPGSPSAALAERARVVHQRALDVAARADALAGEFDAMRANPDTDRGVAIARLRAEAVALEVLARETEAEVTALEASAQVW